jgi:phage gp29-like protein
MARRYAATDSKLTKPDQGPVGRPDALGARSMSLGTSPADGLTPAGLITLLRDATGGDIVDQSKLFEAMEDRDPIIGAHMRTRRSGVLANGLEILPDEEADDQAGAQRAADLCIEAVAEIETRSHNPKTDEGLRLLSGWSDCLSDLLDALGKGFAVTEPIWEKSSSQWRIDHFEWRPQRWFMLSGDELRLRNTTGEGERLNPLNFVVHRHSAMAGVPGADALFRQLARPYVISNYAVKDLLSMGEVFGMPMRIGYYTEGMTDTMKDEIWRALYYLAVDSVAMMPEGTRVEFPEISAANTGNIFERLMDACDKWKTLLCLGQLLTSGGEEGGSYALGQVHERVRFDILDDDARRLEETVREQIFTPLVRLNLGDLPIPRADIPRQPPRDLKEMGEAFAGLAKLGVRIPLSWAHDQTGIPVAEEDEPILVAPEQMDALMTGLGGAAPAETPEAGGDEPVTPEAEEQEEAKLLGMVGGITGLLAIQDALAKGTISREIAVEMTMLFFRIERPEAEKLVAQEPEDEPEQKPQPPPPATEPEPAVAAADPPAGEKKNGPPAGRSARSRRYVC